MLSLGQKDTVRVVAKSVFDHPLLLSSHPHYHNFYQRLLTTSNYIAEFQKNRSVLYDELLPNICRLNWFKNVIIAGNALKNIWWISLQFLPVSNLLSGGNLNDGHLCFCELYFQTESGCLQTVETGLSNVYWPTLCGWKLLSCLNWQTCLWDEGGASLWTSPLRPYSVSQWRKRGWKSIKSSSEIRYPKSFWCQKRAKQDGRKEFRRLNWQPEVGVADTLWVFILTLSRAKNDSIQNSIENIHSMNYSFKLEKKISAWENRQKGPVLSSKATFNHFSYEQRTFLFIQ